MYTPRRANYRIETDFSDMALVIKDVGPWDSYLSVTNAAETVTEELFRAGRLPNGRRLFYYDTEGHLDELVHKEGRFIRFAPLDGRLI